MRHVELELTAEGREAEIHPMYDIMANSSFVERAKTTHWNVSGTELGIMHFIHGDIDQFRDAVASVDEVIALACTTVDDGRFYAYIRSDLTRRSDELFGTLTQGRLVVQHPIEWHPDGTQSVQVMGSTEEIHSVVEDLPEPVECTVREIGGLEKAAEAALGQLSDRQREAVKTALEMGYYDNPRAVTIDDVAEKIGCSKSTAAEHLRKSESKILHTVYEA